ncbi:transglycosylase SLT domain-containing protein [Aureimonas sp. SA4125]|uniref:lytic transglycosylase domain-containing protein n=1 Tax=Aureimonas sp. SA4125 TaxID=2826993 RepID=UPI001CC567D1|nr:transglycosylase SLT domain-containing protein [Aureimonas sp. SA4125]
MRSASEMVWQALRRAPATLRPVALIALAAPFALSACVSNQQGTKSASLTNPASPSSTPATDAYGYAPVRISAFADGTRVPEPSQKPDAARLAALANGTAPGKTGAVAPSAPPADAVAALAADVAERKASTVAPQPAVVTSEAVTPEAVAVKAAGYAAVEKPSAGARIAAAATALNPVTAVPATIAAVADTAAAVTVAAVETTTKAVDVVSHRINDTFKGTDTITGDAAIDRMIERAAADNGIPSELAYAVVRVESHYNPKAKGSGVYGLSQIQPATARGLGFAGKPSDLFDPQTNLRYGMKYLAGAWQKSGHDVCGAAMKYKGGHRTTKMSRSAAVYCANVKRHMAAIERRRGSANRGTLVAAAQRDQQIALASTAPVAKTVAASAIPGVSTAPLAVGMTVAAGNADRSRRVIQRTTPVAASLGLTD